MIFGPEHYVPVLKVKRGEKKALQRLSAKVRSRMTPLLEVVERKGEPDKEPPTIAAHLEKTFKDLATTVAPFKRYFLDCREIAPDGATAAAAVFAHAAELKKVFTPVTGISRAADVKAALSHRANGLAIRLKREEFEAGRIPRHLPAFMKKHDLAIEQTDLIVDLGAVDDMVAPGIEALAYAFLADVPDRTRWRTLTVSGCAFPNSMGGIDRDSFEIVERAEWCAWRDGIYSNRAELDRPPTFSDCAIQHPSGVEGFDPRTMAVSASTRVTLQDHWLLIKGASTRHVPAKEQFPKLATQLVYGHLRDHFAGTAHCDGCRGMRLAADGAPNYGSAEVWRQLGTIHHITRAVEQIAALTWP